MFIENIYKGYYYYTNTYKVLLKLINCFSVIKEFLYSFLVKACTFSIYLFKKQSII